jgi:uncharacterized protein DUF6221
MSSDPVAWLRARLDEAEATARAAGEPWDREGAGQWTSECQHSAWDDEDEPVHEYCTVVTGDIHIYDEGGHDEYQATHIAFWDPATVLRMVEADRRLLELHRDKGDSPGYTESGYGYIDHCCATCGVFGEYGVPWPCATIKIRAQAWGWIEEPG